jgi:hypothetical protein
MDIDGPESVAEIKRGILERIAGNHFRVTMHALEAMSEEGVTLDEVLEAIGDSRILENYGEHRRGPCCLLYGRTSVGRDLHVVCTTGNPILIVITVYEPRPPKFRTPTERSL